MKGYGGTRKWAPFHSHSVSELCLFKAKDKQKLVNGSQESVEDERCRTRRCIESFLPA